MEQTPEWVPEEALAYYRKLRSQGNSDMGFEFDDSDLNALFRCIQSSEMEKAWRAISKRTDKGTPAMFAFFIVVTTKSCRVNIPIFPSRTEIEGYDKLLNKLVALRTEFNTKFKHWGDQTLDQFFSGGTPMETIEKLETELSHVIQARNTFRGRLKALSGHPKSKNSKRTYVIRMLSLQVRHLYDSPLHKVVALTSGAILEEAIEEETVRKLVS